MYVQNSSPLYPRLVYWQRDNDENSKKTTVKIVKKNLQYTECINTQNNHKILNITNIKSTFTEQLGYLQTARYTLHKPYKIKSRP